jgi:CheY-like chemotaxis protein
MAHILVVDDMHEVHDFVKRALGDDHQVFAIDDGTQAVDYIFEHDIDLILMDVEMPGFLQGDHLSDVLKKSLRRRPLKIVLFSSLDEFDLRQKAEQVGADGYICKTFNEKLLQLKIAKYVR